MGLFSNKNKRDRAAEDSGRFYSKDDDAAIGERARAKRASHAGASAGARRTPNDPLLPEKKRARRRLVGAIALALAAAVGLPMLLDSGPKPLAGDIAIQIPAKDKAAPLPAPTAPGDADTAAASTASETAPETSPETSPAPAAAAKPAAPAAASAAHGKSVAAADSVDDGEEVIAAPPPAPKAEARKPEHKDVAKPEHKELARSEPKSEPKPEHKDAAKPEHEREHERDHPKAETRLAEKSHEADKPVKHEESARALAILEGKGAGAQPSVKPVAKPEDKPEAAGSQKSVLQVAAMSSPDKAAEVQARLREAGLSSYTEKAANGLIRVKVSFTKDEADKVHAKLAKLGL